MNWNFDDSYRPLVVIRTFDKEIRGDNLIEIASEIIMMGALISLEWHSRRLWKEAARELLTKIVQITPDLRCILLGPRIDALPST